MSAKQDIEAEVLIALDKLVVTGHISSAEKDEYLKEPFDFESTPSYIEKGLIASVICLIINSERGKNNE